MYFQDDRTKFQKISEYGAGVFMGFSILLLCTAFMARESLKHSISRKKN